MSQKTANFLLNYFCCLTASYMYTRDPDYSFPNFYFSTPILINLPIPNTLLTRLLTFGSIL